MGETYSNNIIYNVKDGIIQSFGRDLAWWLVYIFSVSVCLILDLALITIRTAFWPTDVRNPNPCPAPYQDGGLILTVVIFIFYQVDVFQEIEKSAEMRQRMEEAAIEELKQGWDRDNTTSKAEIEMEGEVQEFLDRPRAMEEEGTPGRKNTGFRIGRGSFAGERGAIEDDINARLARRFGSVKKRSNA